MAASRREARARRASANGSRSGVGERRAPRERGGVRQPTADPDHLARVWVPRCATGEPAPAAPRPTGRGAPEAPRSRPRPGGAIAAQLWTTGRVSARTRAAAGSADRGAGVSAPTSRASGDRARAPAAPAAPSRAAAAAEPREPPSRNAPMAKQRRVAASDGGGRSEPGNPGTRFRSGSARDARMSRSARRARSGRQRRRRHARSAWSRSDRAPPPRTGRAAVYASAATSGAPAIPRAEQERQRSADSLLAIAP
jgi:hypothetical protein